jgi:hypothetical protein
VPRGNILNLLVFFDKRLGGGGQSLPLAANFAAALTRH